VAGFVVASVDARAQSAVDLSRRVAVLVGEARSQDGLLAVAVGSSGQLLRLDIDDDARRRSGAEISRDIMALVGRAQANLSARVVEQVRETVGEDTETGPTRHRCKRAPAGSNGSLPRTGLTSNMDPGFRPLASP
jgi:YbaB/EbfC DNA-binding family